MRFSTVYEVAALRALRVRVWLLSIISQSAFWSS